MKTHKIDAPNGAIAIHESADQGPPVVLIHGNSSSSSVFSRQLDGPLGERFRLIAVDLPGHGASDDAKDPSAYSLPGHARAVRAVLDALGIDEAHFVGWSVDDVLRTDGRARSTLGQHRPRRVPRRVRGGARSSGPARRAARW